MLSKTRIDMIAARKTLGNSADDKKQKKYIDYTLRQHVKKQLDSMGDLLLVLKELPEDQLKKIISPKQAYEAMQVVEKLVELLEPASIETKDGKPRVVHKFSVMGKVFDLPDNAESIVKITFPAKPEEFDLSEYVVIHANIMCDILKAQSEKKVTIADFNKKILPQMAKRALDRGQIYQVEYEGSAAFEDRPEEEPK